MMRDFKNTLMDLVLRDSAVCRILDEVREWGKTGVKLTLENCDAYTYVKELPQSCWPYLGVLLNWMVVEDFSWDEEENSILIIASNKEEEEEEE